MDTEWEEATLGSIVTEVEDIVDQVKEACDVIFEDFKKVGS